MNSTIKRKYVFNLSWPPVLVLGIIVLVDELLGARYRFLTPHTFAIVTAIAVLLAGYTFFEEKHSHFARAVLSTGLLVACVTAVEIAGLTHLIALAFAGANGVQGTQLLASGVYVWVCNVLTFGLWYWLIDRGGPHTRAQGIPARPEFLFPEMTAADTAKSEWTPGLIEYMYLAFTNATAFSPTDTLPLSSRARLLMTIESSMSLVTIALVAARAVNISS